MSYLNREMATSSSTATMQDDPFVYAVCQMPYRSPEYLPCATLKGFTEEVLAQFKPRCRPPTAVLHWR